MNTIANLSFLSHANAFDRGLSLEAVRARAPAVFADSALEGLSSKYTFIPTSRVLTGLMDAGFVPVEARQTCTRSASPLHARHVIRLRRRCETVSLEEGGSVPEVIFLNSHDGGSSYIARIGIFRVVCCNGLIASRGAFPAYCVPHRGNVVDAVIAAALQVSEQFERLAAQVECMERRRMLKDEQLRFAEAALALRYPDRAQSGMQPSQLLTCRRSEDLGENLWVLLNRVQEHLCVGGLSRRSTNGRLVRTRRLTSIKREVQLNGKLWDLATDVLAA
jgi:Domain of unknown function (DUF932)